MMKEKLTVWKESLGTILTITKKEYVTTVLLSLLGGVILGMFLSPRKNTVIGSYNNNILKGVYGIDEDRIKGWNK